jgi:hypothetical protein
MQRAALALARFDWPGGECISFKSDGEPRKTRHNASGLANADFYARAPNVAQAASQRGIPRQIG